MPTRNPFPPVSLKTLFPDAQFVGDDDILVTHAIATQFDNIKAELKTAERTLEDREKLHQPQELRPPEVEVERALQLVGEINRVTGDKSARGSIRPLILKFGIRLGLNFGAAMKGTREVRNFLGGVIAFGNKPLPVPIHGYNNRDDGDPGQCNSNGQTAKESADTLKSDRIAGLAPIMGDGSQAPAVSGNDRQHEGVSFTKVSRGDRTPLELFLAGLEGWNAALRWHFPGENRDK